MSRLPNDFALSNRKIDTIDNYSLAVRFVDIL